MVWYSVVCLGCEGDGLGRREAEKRGLNEDMDRIGPDSISDGR